MEAGTKLDETIAEKVMGEPKPVYVPDSMQVLSATLDGDVIWSEGHNWYWTCEYDKGDVPVCYPPTI